jgi:hypothetical protein
MLIIALRFLLVGLCESQCLRATITHWQELQTRTVVTLRSGSVKKLTIGWMCAV